MSDDERKIPSAGFAPIFVRVPVMTAEDLRELDETADVLIAAGNRARAQGKRIKRLIEAAHAEFGNGTVSPATPTLAPVTSIDTAVKRRNLRNKK